MSTDRELLELAAKAAGIRPNHMEGFIREDGVILFYLDCEGRTFRTWNPLTDDGDALRLAVELHIPLETDEWGALIDVVGRIYESAEDNGGSVLAATRRAIVRAAAEIGRAMQ